MAEGKFSPKSRTSAIADSLLRLFGGLFLLHLLSTAAAKPPSSRIDDGGITVPPALPIFSRQVIAIKSRPLTLHCPILLAPTVRVLDAWWTKDWVKLDLDQPSFQGADAVPPRIYITNDRDLHFDKITHKVGVSRGLEATVNSRHGKNYTDEGDYRCYVKSSIGVVFSPVITVSVAVFDARQEYSEVKVRESQVALLSCQINSVPPLRSSNVLWQHGRTNISHSAQESGSNRFKILSSGTLVIFNVQRSDAGSYSCLAWHDTLSVNKSLEVKLVVDQANELVSQEPPKFLFTSDYEVQKPLILDEDEENTLDCAATGIPMPTISWVSTRKVANGTNSATISTVLQEGKGYYDSLLLDPDSSSVDKGNFTCVADNSIGNPLSKVIEVVRLPALIKAPLSHRHPPSRTVRFECKVPPTFTLIWYKDGQLLETGRGRVKAKGNEIVISNTIKNDSGFYQCEVVADDQIYAVGTARLLVENNREAPEAPYDIQCVQSFPKSLIISWKVASPKNISAFSIHYTSPGGEEWQRVVPSKQTNITLESLKPYTAYTIYVRSYSTNAASGQSQKFVCSTLEDIPVRPISTFFFDRHGPLSQMRMRWRPLPDNLARGKVILYKLQWRSLDGEYTNVRYIGGDADEFLITDLPPGEPFEIRLLPRTNAGWPNNREQTPWTHVNSTNFDMNGTVPSSPDYYTPPMMDLTVLNVTSIMVNWSEPERDSGISLKGYRLTYSSVDPLVEDWVYYGPVYIANYSQRHHLFTDFSPSTAYEVHLQTFGDSWESEVTSRFIRTFSETGDESDGASSPVLPAISGLQVLPTSSSQAIIKWDPPKVIASQAHFYYVVRYKSLDDSVFRYISSTSESVEIKELKPFTLYEFSVQIMGDEGVGPFSQKIESRTLPGLPGAPVQLHWRVLNQSLVEIEWVPPPAANGVIQKYWVQYRHKNQSSQVEEKLNSNVSSIANDASWKNKSTRNTSVSLDNLIQNQEYLVRVIAETKAGIGHPSEAISIRIFRRKPSDPPPPKDSPPPASEGVGVVDTPTSPDQRLGFIIGIALSGLIIILCAIIILTRHRLFPILARQPVGVHVNGNGFPPRAKRSIESFTGVEMKVLESLTATDQHLDTKSGHSQANGVIPGPTDPLLMRIVRNPIDDRAPAEEEMVPNCTH